MTRLRVLAAPFVLAALLAACTSGGETPGGLQPGLATTSDAPSAQSPVDPTPTPTTDVRTELEGAVRDYSDAFFDGAGLGAWDLLSQRCQAVEDKDDFVGSIVAFGALIGDATPEMTKLTIDSLKGTEATVTYDYDRGDYGQTRQPWALEDGGWRYDHC